MILPDILGHIGYGSLFFGTLLVGRKLTVGWPLRLTGELVWVAAGLMLGLSSIVIWGTFFSILDGWGWYKWRKDANKDTERQG